MRLEWSPAARADRAAIFDYIEADRPLAATDVDERICAQIAGLARLPEIGRSGRVPGTRELVITGTPYIVAYRIVKGKVLILRVLHGARKWPKRMR